MHSSASIGLQEIMAHLQTARSVATTMRAARAAGFAADPTDDHVTAFARLLADVGIEQLGAFDEVVSKNEADLPGYFERLYAKMPKVGAVTANVPFLCELVLVLEFGASLTAKELTDIGWQSDFAQIALDIAESTRSAPIGSCC
jgi:hypothetical protein